MSSDPNSLAVSISWSELLQNTATLFDPAEIYDALNCFFIFFLWGVGGGTAEEGKAHSAFSQRMVYAVFLTVVWAEL